MAAEPTRVAVVDIGTNSTRLLIADIAPDDRITEVERRSTVTRLGRGVDLSGALSVEAAFVATVVIVVVLAPIAARAVVARVVAARAARRL